MAVTARKPPAWVLFVVAFAVIISVALFFAVSGEERATGKESPEEPAAAKVPDACPADHDGPNRPDGEAAPIFIAESGPYYTNVDAELA